MTHKEQIREVLERGEAITPIDALQMFGCFRLGARIYDLRQEGLSIRTNMSKAGYAIYRMEQT